MTDATACKTAPGTWLGDGSTCPKTGACRYKDGTSKSSVDAATCSASGGSYLGDGTYCTKG